MKLFLALSLMAISGMVLADAGIQFKFRVFSSDDKMYVCNAGIKHVDGLVGNGDIDPNLTTDHDYLQLKWGTLNEAMVLGAIQDLTVKPSGTAGFENYVFAWGAQDNTAEQFARKITQMNLILTSEQYGASYFVDVCYRGVQVDFDAFSLNTDFRLTKSQVYYRDLGAGQDYAVQSNLAVKSTVSCVTQRDVAYNSALSTIPSVITSGAEYLGSWDVATGWQNVPGDATTVNFVSSPYPQVDQDDTDAPVYCVIRYFFNEQATGERNWQEESGEFTLRAEIRNVE